MDNQVAVVSFYSFHPLTDIETLLPKILLVGKKKYIRGTILLAAEGFNGSISGSIENTNILLKELIRLTGAQDVNIKVNYCQIHPFRKLKVTVKPEIVAMKIKNLDAAKLKGKYIEPQDWDNFAKQPDVILIDTRNNYEVEVGTFKDSINPNTDSFRQFPQWVENNKHLLQDKKIGMFCTGGIRCEKSTAYLRSLGFEEVYHLKGGILQYLEDTQNTSKFWQGECFVFDDRRGVDDELKPSRELS